MGQRSVNRKGWGPLATPLTPAGLTTAYPFQQTFVPALYMQPSTVVGDEPTREIVAIPGTRHNYSVLSYSPSVSEYAFWVFAFIRKEIAVTPQFTIYPAWMQIDDVTAPASKDIVWGTSITNKTLGGTLDFDSTLNQVNMTSPAKDKFGVSGGSTGDSNEGLGNDTINGSAISTTLMNFITFTIARRGDLAADVYANDAKLMGCILQWSTDFGNIAAIPRDTT